MKPRKNILLWQNYLWWHEMVEQRKTHATRIKHALSGRSNMDVDFEEWMLSNIYKYDIDTMIENQKQSMITEGMLIPVWSWVTQFKGMKAGSLPAQLLAQIDNIENFDTVAKLWRFSGYGLAMYWKNGNSEIKAPLDGWKWTNKKRQWTVVLPKANWDEYEHYPYEIENGKLLVPEDSKITDKVKFIEPGDGWYLAKSTDKLVASYHSPFSGLLKGILYNIGQQFIYNNTHPYYDLYYEYRLKQKEKHPVPYCGKCKIEAVPKLKGDKFRCPKDSGHNKQLYFTDNHFDFRGRRRMIKGFLKDLWLEWRKSEGLPVSEEYRI